MRAAVLSHLHTFWQPLRLLGTPGLPPGTFKTCVPVTLFRASLHSNYSLSDRQTFVRHSL